MASRREYEMLFQLNAQLGGSYNSTFKSAQTAIASMQKEILALSKAQADISAYQRQQGAVEATGQKLAVLQQQYDNIQKEIKETEGYSASLANQLLAKQQQIDKTSSSLERQKEKLDQMSAALKQAGVSTDSLDRESAELGRQMEELKKKQEAAAEGANDFGNNATEAVDAVQEALAAAGIAVALKAIYDEFVACRDAAIEFESVMTGVAKTTDMSDRELADMAAAIKELSTEIPVTTSELAAVAEVAGQLGIAKEDLLDFSTVMSMLATATTMTADEAATMLAQFANITQMDPSYYDELGSTIVDLGNNYATTEQKITEMSQGIAASASLAGMSEADMLGLSAAVSSLGIESQMGSTAISKLISDLMTAVETGKDLDEFARIANMSAADFSRAWGEDAAGALTSFVTGLSDTSRLGASAIVTLTDLGITETRMQRTILSLSNSGDLLNNTISTANQAWAENNALTNEAEKRYATTASQQEMMESATNNLRIALGDNFTPVLKELYALWTDVLKGFTDFVQEHPALIKAIAAFVAIFGAVVAALAAYAAIAKIAAAASVLLTAAIPGVNIIMAVTAAIAAITAGIVALVSANNEAVPSVRELTEAARGMSETMDEATAAYDDTVTATMAAASVADNYIGKLEAMEAAGITTDEQAKQYHNTLALLCQVVPELAGQIDLETDTINGGTEALRANTEAWKKNAMQQAYQEQLTALYKSYSAVLIEAEENSMGLTKAQYSLETAQKKQENAMARMNQLYTEASDEATAYNKEYGAMADATGFLTQEYHDLERSLYEINDEIWTSEQAMANYQKAIEEDSEAVADAEAEITLAEEAVRNLTDATDDGAVAAAEAARQEQELQATISDVTAQMVELADAYSDAYDAALTSISGQYDLWDKAASVVATSASTINSALESQVTYWQDYNTNLQALGEREKDIQGLSDMIASFADGSADSVNAIAGMANASDEDLAAMVANWQTLQAEQEAASGSIADLKTDFTAAMDELQKELAADIEAMDLGTEAAESGKATIQGFIDGAAGMLSPVQTAYARVAQAARNALSTGPVGPVGGVTGYAVGTQSAAPGYALVGEKGPELVYFNGGERVLTAEETAAMKNGYSAADIQAVALAPQMMEYLAATQGNGAISAESNRGGGSVSLKFEPVYHISGIADAAGIEAVLQKHDEGMRDYIIEVMEEHGIDVGRRSYK